MRRIIALIFGIMLALPAHAVQVDEILPDKILEQRARDISAGLRCLVCQNQSIDDSDAPLAKDLRVLVRERLKAGDSDAQVSVFLVDRYGEFILLKPTFSYKTLALWLFPLVCFVLALTLILARRNQTLPKDDVAGKLSAKEREQLAKILNPDKS